MKAVDVDMKSCEVVEYFPQLEQVKLKLLVNDGREKASVKQLELKDPERIAQAWIKELRDKLKAAHSEDALDDHPLANAVVLRFKQEEDKVYERLAKFLYQVHEKIASGKRSKLSYFDLQKSVSRMSTTF